MASYPDEVLMAYADGELTPEEARELEAWLAADPALRARLEPFTATRGSLAGVFDGAFKAPVPERLVAVVRADAAARRRAPAAGRRQNHKSFLEAMAAALLPEGFGLGGATAAALLLIGVALGVVATRIASPDAAGAVVASDDRGRLVATGLLERALSTVPSEVSSGSGATVVTPVKTFRDRDRNLCRQYELDVGSTHLAGVACRAGNGPWQIALYSERPAGRAIGSYETAGTAEPPAVQAAVAAMMQGEPLSPDDEKAVLAQGRKD